ncbi:MAG: tetratricopeptide repeat protein [bacterium]
MQRIALLTIGLAVLMGCPGLTLAEESAAELSVEAQRECDVGRRASDRSDRLAHFEKGQTLAERAVGKDDDNADGHFALFCNLGEQIRIDGENWNPGSIFVFGRLMNELDRTLELKPDHLDALSSKGTFLVRLPGLLGGDAAKGEQMLRRVIQRDPKSVNARMTLAKTYAVGRSFGQAITLATEAVAIAQADQRDDLIREAQKTLAEIREAYAEVLTVQR